MKTIREHCAKQIVYFNEGLESARAIKDAHAIALIILEIKKWELLLEYIINNLDADAKKAVEAANE